MRANVGISADSDRSDEQPAVVLLVFLSGRAVLYPATSGFGRRHALLASRLLLFFQRWLVFFLSLLLMIIIDMLVGVRLCGHGDHAESLGLRLVDLCRAGILAVDLCNVVAQRDMLLIQGWITSNSPPSELV